MGLSEFSYSKFVLDGGFRSSDPCHHLYVFLNFITQDQHYTIINIKNVLNKKHFNTYVNKTIHTHVNLLIIKVGGMSRKALKCAAAELFCHTGISDNAQSCAFPQSRTATQTCEAAGHLPLLFFQGAGDMASL